ncbi:MAG: hypothetical protein AAB527_04070 [Patescibacteria group bacterium]
MWDSSAFDKTGHLNPAPVSDQPNPKKLILYRGGIKYTLSASDNITKFLEQFNQFGGDELIRLEQGSHEALNLKVNWRLYIDAFNKASSFNRRPEFFNKILVSAGILSYQRKNNWMILSQEILLNPSSAINLYFTRKKDAIDYARVELINASYFWEICQVTEVISSSAVRSSAS